MQDHDLQVENHCTRPRRFVGGAHNSHMLSSNATVLCSDHSCVSVLPTLFVKCHEIPCSFPRTSHGHSSAVSESVYHCDSAHLSNPFWEVRHSQSRFFGSQAVGEM